jgi:hypothetical protein
MNKQKSHWICRRFCITPTYRLWIYLPSHRGVAASYCCVTGTRSPIRQAINALEERGSTSEVYSDSIYIRYVHRCNINIIVQLAPRIKIQIGKSRNAATGWQ